MWVEGAFAADDDAIDVGTRRELFVDASLIQSLDGEARQMLHHPTPREIVLVCDRPWEGNGLNYVTVFRDGDVYKMYYRGGDYDRGCDPTHEQVYCYAESRDGVEWTRPNLGLVEFAGSKENNILLTEKDKELGYICHNFSPFLDTNPAAPAAERYKAIGGGPLVAMVSPDGLRWKKASATPIVTVGDFDSQNLAFWDAVRGEYRAYHRKFRDGRDVMTETSKTFFDGWTEPVFLEYTPSRGGELYTNQVTPYHRAPHYYLGFPTRYEDRGLTPSTQHLPQWDYRQQRSARSPREGTAVTEGLFMASRDGLHFPDVRRGFHPARPSDAGQLVLRRHVPEQRAGRDAVVARPGRAERAVDVRDRGDAAKRQAGQAAALHAAAGRLRFDQRDHARRKARHQADPLLRQAADAELTRVRPGAAFASGCSTRRASAIAGYSLDECPWIYGDAIDRPVEWTRDKDVTDRRLRRRGQAGPHGRSNSRTRICTRSSSSSEHPVGAGQP